MMQTKRFEAAATTFSRVSAAPPPLISTPSAVASSAPSMYSFRSPAAIQIEFRESARLRVFRMFGASSRLRRKAGFCGLSALR